MKIEKLTENKIRVIINSNDLNGSNTDIHSFIDNSFKNQDFFLNILEKAEKEVGFCTDGCKLLIETFSSADEFLVFTITKSTKNVNNKKPLVKRKTLSLSDKQVFFSFETFEQFYEFCTFIHNNNNLEIKKISNNISLYLYNSIYFLAIENINVDYIYLKQFYMALSEFGTLHSFSPNFRNKLDEHGELILLNSFL